MENKREKDEALVAQLRQRAEEFANEVRAARIAGLTVTVDFEDSDPVVKKPKITVGAFRRY